MMRLKQEQSEAMINLNQKCLSRKLIFCILDGFHVVVLLNDARSYTRERNSDRHAIEYTSLVLCVRKMGIILLIFFFFFIEKFTKNKIQSIENC